MFVALVRLATYQMVQWCRAGRCCDNLLSRRNLDFGHCANGRRIYGERNENARTRSKDDSRAVTIGDLTDGPDLSGDS
jgi:hypothetical protein